MFFYKEDLATAKFMLFMWQDKNNTDLNAEKVSKEGKKKNQEILHYSRVSVIRANFTSTLSQEKSLYMYIIVICIVNINNVYKNGTKTESV